MTRIYLPTDKMKILPFILQWDPGENAFVSSVASPMREWLIAHGESTRLYSEENDLWLEFKDPDNALLYKLTWGGV